MPDAEIYVHTMDALFPLVIKPWIVCLICCVAQLLGRKRIKSICHQLFSKLSIKQFEQHYDMSHNKIKRKCLKTLILHFV